jgi:hypothetical protein
VIAGSTPKSYPLKGRKPDKLQTAVKPEHSEIVGRFIAAAKTADEPAERNDL